MTNIKMAKTKMDRIYLDHAATTPILPEVIDKMSEIMKNSYGNASSLHYLGIEAREILEESRKKIAFLINADPEEIYFTSGGTEGDNIAILGSLPNRCGDFALTSVIEHEAVIETFKHLEKIGIMVKFAPVNDEGFVDLDYLKNNLHKGFFLVSIMAANNEIGTIQPIREINRISENAGAFVHTDAVQAVGKIPINVKELGVNFLSASAHKFYGPKGVGFLYVKKDTPVSSIIFGGGHERGLRSGTENVPGAAGMALALELCINSMDKDHIKYNEWSERIISEAGKTEEFKLNGSRKNRIPGTLSLSFKNINGESLMQILSIQGIAVSTASACQSHAAKRGYSHVIQSLGVEESYANGTIRISLGKDNTDEQIDFFIEALKKSLKRLREFGNGL